MKVLGDDEAAEVLAMPQPLPLHAYDLFIHAWQYQEATEILASAQGEPPYKLGFPMYFTLSHSLELYLKAFLVMRGMTKKETIKHDIRHSPHRLFELCQDQGLSHVDFLEQLTMQIQEMNSSYDFRYPTGYLLHLPTMRLCLPVLKALHDLLRPMIEQSRAEGQIKWSSDTRHLRGRKIRWSD